jgi:SAM-dependent methyltransferase
MDYFSHSEVPSLCLRDVSRTKLFKTAILRSVKPGDIVLDLGSGSGILSMFAAQAGAEKVYAVEVDPSLCERLRINAVANGFGDVIEVVCADARELQLPVAIDVVIAEMIETWLLDELQMPALNALQRSGIIKPNVRLIPANYEAFIEFGNTDFSFYGFHLPFPIHDWPDLDAQRGWKPMIFRAATDRIKAFNTDFAIQEDVQFDKSICFTPKESMTLNAIRLSGVAKLCDDISIGDTPSFNGNKIYPMAPIQVTAGQSVTFSVSGCRGAGEIVVDVVRSQELSGLM